MLLTDPQIQCITELKRPKAQARKLQELGFVVLGFSARGHVRALAAHPGHPAQQEHRPQDIVRLDL